MGATANFIKLRSKEAPKVGQWNYNFSKALALAKKNGKFIITCWTNGDKCGWCISAEVCMTQQVFKDWVKATDAYFVFQYSGDANGGKAVYDWIYKPGKISQFPGFRITRYDPKTGEIAYDKIITGNNLRNNKAKVDGAKAMIANLKKMLANKPAEKEDVAPAPVVEDYKIRLNEKITVAQVNKILDAIDKAGGYCPCQVKSADTKCHCKDFLQNKKIGEVCICNLYVKMKK